ncbi:hypothetical protein FAZ69_23440 [Trinickia terrae]|uniref:CopG family transcriptional regulator n=1 Tax=Trinickia terrae TaxID=2571161 RepID=A0A4U1HWV2_9BURK|nr:hypothetical protein FAZ69_23440 [Trinickia terrae]
MTKPKGPSRQPRGVLSPKPVYVRLMPEERRALEYLSCQEKRSMSQITRAVFLEGIERYKAKLRRSATQPHSTNVAGH